MYIVPTVKQKCLFLPVPLPALQYRKQSIRRGSQLHPNFPLMSPQHNTIKQSTSQTRTKITWLGSRLDFHRSTQLFTDFEDILELPKHDCKNTTFLEKDAYSFF